MTPEQFCYWLQGFGELSSEPPTPEQWKSINEHLQTVFKKVTPPVGPAIAGLWQQFPGGVAHSSIGRQVLPLTC